MGRGMSLPTKAPAWANHITILLQTIQKTTGNSMYPIKIKDIIFDLSRSFFPDAPITKITGENFGNGFEGMLLRVSQSKNEWGIIYNTAIKSSGRINFTLAHEFGHYLLHRMALKDGNIKCTRQDMFEWNSEYGQREAEANEFASYLLMPRNLFENIIKKEPISLHLLQEAAANEFASYLLMPRNLFENIIKKEPISLHLLQEAADYFNVSLTAAILKWLQFTDKRAMLVVGVDGFVKWCWSSKKLYKSGVFLQPKKQAIELPAQSIAMLKDKSINSKKGIIHPSGFLGFNEEAHEMSLIADSYDMTISLLIFPDDAPNKWIQQDEEPELMDSFEKFSIL
jgi:Zn-dependent peptidase ImmA (M78 family)